MKIEISKLSDRVFVGIELQMWMIFKHKLSPSQFEQRKL